AGSASLDDIPLIGRSSKARARIGYVPEGADPPPHLTTAELLALCSVLKHAPLPPADVIDRLGVRPLIDQDQLLHSLSLGQRRRACLAAALVGDPALL